MKKESPCKSCSRDAVKDGLCKVHLHEQRIQAATARIARDSKNPAKNQERPTSSLGPLATCQLLTPAVVPIISQEAEQETRLPRCVFEACPRRLSKEVGADDLCSWHYHHQLAGLNLEPIPSPIPSDYICDAPGCECLCHANGFCYSCEKHLKSHRKLPGEEEECTTPGCSKPQLPGRTICNKCLLNLHAFRRPSEATSREEPPAATD